MHNLARKIGAGALGIVVMTMLGATAALATPGPLDGLKTEGDAAKAEFTDFVTTWAVPFLFGLLLLGVGIGLATKYIRRGARSA